jgi:hypothetical protein
VWNELLPQLASIVLSDEQNEFRWNLVSNKQFSDKSHYLVLIHLDVPNLNKRLWKLKAPLKIKIFLCYLRRGAIKGSEKATRGGSEWEPIKILQENLTYVLN